MPLFAGAAVQVQLYRRPSLWKVPVQSLVSAQEIPGELIFQLMQMQIWLWSKQKIWSSCWFTPSVTITNHNYHRKLLWHDCGNHRLSICLNPPELMCVSRWCLAAGLMREQDCRGRCLCLYSRRCIDSLGFPSSVLLHRSTVTSSSTAPLSPTSMASSDPEGKTGVACFPQSSGSHFLTRVTHGAWREVIFVMMSKDSKWTVCVRVFAGPSCPSVQSVALLKPTLPSVKSWWMPWWRTLRSVWSRSRSVVDFSSCWSDTGLILVCPSGAVGTVLWASVLHRFRSWVAWPCDPSSYPHGEQSLPAPSAQRYSLWAWVSIGEPAHLQEVLTTPCTLNDLDMSPFFFLFSQASRNEKALSEISCVCLRPRETKDIGKQTWFAVVSKHFKLTNILYSRHISCCPLSCLVIVFCSFILLAVAGTVWKGGENVTIIDNEPY